MFFLQIREIGGTDNWFKSPSAKCCAKSRVGKSYLYTYNTCDKNDLEKCDPVLSDSPAFVQAINSNVSKANETHSPTP